jgi:purine-binding chemotaxis protein CheW
MTHRSAREILEERARMLARPLASLDALSAGDATAITFSVARERYAVESRFVFAVFRLTDLTPLPGAEAHVAGLTRWRGDLLTLLDVRGLVGAPTHGLDDLARVIVIGARSAEFGLLADTVGDPMPLRSADIVPLPPGRGAATHVLRGVTRDAILVLDAAALIARQTEPAPSSSIPAPSP